MQPDLTLDQDNQLDIIDSMHIVVWELKTIYVGYVSECHELELEENKAEIQHILVEFHDLQGNRIFDEILEMIQEIQPSWVFCFVYDCKFW